VHSSVDRGSVLEKQNMGKAREAGGGKVGRHTMRSGEMRFTRLPRFGETAGVEAGFLFGLLVAFFFHVVPIRAESAAVNGDLTYLFGKPDSQTSHFLVRAHTSRY
jgi:hypothetical protein